MLLGVFVAIDLAVAPCINEPQPGEEPQPTQPPPGLAAVPPPPPQPLPAWVQTWRVETLTWRTEEYIRNFFLRHGLSRDEVDGIMSAIRGEARRRPSRIHACSLWGSRRAFAHLDIWTCGHSGIRTFRHSDMYFDIRTFGHADTQAFGHHVDRSVDRSVDGPRDPSTDLSTGLRQVFFQNMFWTFRHADMYFDIRTFGRADTQAFGHHVDRSVDRSVDGRPSTDLSTDVAC